MIWTEVEDAQRWGEWEGGGGTVDSSFKTGLPDKNYLRSLDNCREPVPKIANNWEKKMTIHFRQVVNVEIIKLNPIELWKTYTDKSTEVIVWQK